MNRLIALLALLLTMSACKEAEVPPKIEDNTLTGVNKWIREQLEDWYYWQEELVASKAPSNSLNYQDFLTQSLIHLNARDLTETPPTMDGKYNSDGSRRLYSRIGRISGVGTRASASEQITYGFSVVPVGYVDQNGIIADYLSFLVTWTLPGGPADNAGIARGMWIDRYNGKEIHSADVQTFGNHLFSQSTVPMNITVREGLDYSTSGKEYSIPGESSRITPILKDEVIESPVKKRKVAYLMYNAFESGEIESNQLGEFDRELRDVFGSFKTLGAEELVVDLRYNGGGSVNSSQLLSSLAGDVSTDKIFAKMFYNEGISQNGLRNPQLWTFMNEPNSLKLRKVYALVTGDTASASELFVNALRGVDIDVVLIGETTEGKNVGMNLLEHTEGGYKYELWPISFKSKNAKDFCDYAGGFDPDVEINEMTEVLDSNPEGDLYQFGDPRDLLLNAALRMIDGETVQSQVSTRAVDFRATHSLSDPRKGGARVLTLPDQR